MLKTCRSRNIRRNFGTRSAPSSKTSASAKHYKGMFGAPLARMTRSSAVVEKPHDASCLSVVSFKFQHTYSAVFLLPVTAASDLLVSKQAVSLIKICKTQIMTTA